MPSPLGQTGRQLTSRARLRHSGRSLTRVGTAMLLISLVIAVIAGLSTRMLLTDLHENSAELLDGTVSASLDSGVTRNLYVTGGLIAPGETAPTPVDEIRCTVTGPEGTVPVRHLADADRQVGLNNPLARFQLIGSFRAAGQGEHTIECEGRGVVVAPEFNPATGLLRIGGLMLGSLGVFGGATLILIGGMLLLSMRRSDVDDSEDEEEVVAEPPHEGAGGWWERESATRGQEDD